ncbi:MACRO domain containing 2 [Reticulomyxa filosa]|uniref:MACRO domain containing 2 n=1 Tax=Reticulomyxa filosa TaxID=46433 RepID=X6NJX5_RETFI|nr:MACRO domain containing 2 [Reticulomyxa filosa]|eukprot:ETO26024.1 MACRO domain containing 2 [Reticulomyxa filosa]
MSTRNYETVELFNRKVFHYHGDITKLRVGCIVNAANDALLSGGGVCGAIFDASGATRALKAECEHILETECADTDERVPTGQCVLTNSYDLPCKFLLHAVGPAEDDEDSLSECYSRIMGICFQNELRSVAIPCISTGVFGFDNEKGCECALRSVREWFEKASKLVPAHRKSKKHVKRAQQWLNNSKWKDKCKNPDTKKIATFDYGITRNDKQESERSFLDEIDQVIFVTFLEKDKLYYQQHINTYFPGYKEFRELQVVLSQKEKQKNAGDEKDKKNESKNNNANTNHNEKKVQQ